MEKIKQYSIQLRKQLIKENAAWDLVRESNPSQEYEDEKFNSTLKHLGLEMNEIRDEVAFISEKLIKTNSFSAQLDILSTKIKEEIADFTNNQHGDQLSRTLISFLPSGLIKGFCLSKDDFGETLDGYFIGIHEGLYFSLQFLSKALILEQLEGEYLIYKRSGATTYQAAIDLFIKPSPAGLNGIFFEDLPADVDGALSGAQSAAAMMILRFIAFHEFGHIINNDLDLMDAYQMHLHSTQNKSIKNQRKYWKAEYKADEYALSLILKNSSSNLSAWANFIPIYTFFHWLSDVEIKQGKVISESHPPPLRRAERLKNYMIKNIPGWDDYKYEILWVNEITHRWTNQKQET